MRGFSANILGRIGHTALVPLRRVVPGNSAQILLKLEGGNPTGSMKDRMALAMIEAAEADGRLVPGGSVVEYTGGSTGVSLSLVCAVKGYPLYIVSSDAFTQEKLDHMRILGAKLKVIPSDHGRMTEELFRTMIATAGAIVKETGGFWTDQLNNSDQLTAYKKMGAEIWCQTEGRVDGFVQSVGTGACLRGNAEELRRHNEKLQVVAVEPAESSVLSGGERGAHRIDGIGTGFIPPLWKRELPNQIERVSTEEATEMALRLAREEGIFAGTSTGANVVGALRLAEQMGRGATVVTVMVDTGMKYLRTFGAMLG